MESTAFRPVVTVFNAAINAVVATDTAATNVANTQFTPAAGISYYLRATSVAPGATGYFDLLVGTPPEGPVGIAVGTSTNGARLETTDAQDPAFLPDIYYFDDYEITGVTAGQRITVSMSSDEVDSQVSIFDSSGGLVAENDDFAPPGRNAKVTFTAGSGETYFIFASTGETDEIGAYELAVTSP
jgi:hypothetical protein